MKSIKNIDWKGFKKTLNQNSELNLQFQYAENKLVNASYHITEIKQAPIISVDCGGVMSNWIEIIIQLWEPINQHQAKSMKVKKALAIINIVEQKLQLEPSAIVKIEFGNAGFDTRQMLINEINLDDESLLIDLRPDTVQCKAIEHGGSCGTEKPKVKLNNLSKSAECCTPDSGCC